jgi:hypothetical protein
VRDLLKDMDQIYAFVSPMDTNSTPEITKIADDQTKSK